MLSLDGSAVHTDAFCVISWPAHRSIWNVSDLTEIDEWLRGVQRMLFRGPLFGRLAVDTWMHVLRHMMDTIQVPWEQVCGKSYEILGYSLAVNRSVVYPTFELLWLFRPVLQPTVAASMRLSNQRHLALAKVKQQSALDCADNSDDSDSSDSEATWPGSETD